MLDTEGFGEGYRYAYPVFSRDVERTGDLDIQVKASGYKRKLNDEDRTLQNAVSSMRGEGDQEVEESSEDGSDETDDEYDEEDDLSDFSDDEENGDEEENEKIIEALSTGVGKLKMDKLGNYILEE
ncbi:unnamed protein product [Ambrosiozyma monospora]|nr:unnamed protein product [Ambrosiozyma monospora]